VAPSSPILSPDHPGAGAAPSSSDQDPDPIQINPGAPTSDPDLHTGQQISVRSVSERPHDLLVALRRAPIGADLADLGRPDL
jgi:hypothetical protein